MTVPKINLRRQCLISSFLDSKQDTRRELKGAWASGAEYLTRSCAGLAVIGLVQDVAITGEIRDVENIENLGNES
jgi:hypothetical protein